MYACMYACKYVCIYVHLYIYACVYECGYEYICIRFFFIYKLPAPPKHGIRSQLVQKSSHKELQSKANE